MADSGASGAENVFGAEDHREPIALSDKANGKPHPAHAAIFQIRAFCQQCNLVYLGSGFLVRELHSIRDSGQCFYFVTAAHCLFCIHHGHGYMTAQIALEWHPNEEAPQQALPSKDSWIGERNNGWMFVNQAFIDECKKTKGKPKAVRECAHMPYDFGLLAVDKQCASDALAKFPLDPANLVAGVDPGNFHKVAFLCGYPAEVRGKTVRGDMYWVPDDPTAHPPGQNQLHIGIEDATELSGKERSAPALYSMPQYHVHGYDPSHDNPDGSGSRSDTGSNAVKETLFRHYIDSSGGQSGSPLYVIEKNDFDENQYRAVAIHVGYFDIDGQPTEKWCNAGVKLTKSVLKTMMDWVKNQPKLVPSAGAQTQPEPAKGCKEEVASRTLLFGTGKERGNDETDGSNAAAAVGTGGGSGGVRQGSGGDKQQANSSVNPWTTPEFTERYREWVMGLDPKLFSKSATTYKLLTNFELDILEDEQGKSAKNTKFIALATSKEATGFGKFLKFLEGTGHGEKAAEMRKNVPGAT